MCLKPLISPGPRWASWNLGVFMCIRCAGIHRNLGVHIARVKSVNLDQWTPEQIQVKNLIQSLWDTATHNRQQAVYSNITPKILDIHTRARPI